MDFRAINIKRVVPTVSSLSIVIGLSLISPLSMGGQKVDSQEFTPQTILSTVMPGPKWYQDITMPASASTFTYDDSATNPASVINAVDLTYFTGSTDCTGAPAGSGKQTITGGSFAISNGTTVSLNQMSAYSVGDNDGITMGSVQSIAVVFKSSSTADVPQSQFGTSNYQCIQVSCSGSSCTETGGSAPYSFTMRSATNAQVGDYADGGVIACLNGGNNDLVVPISDQDGGSGQTWSDTNATTGATSTTDGASNTTTIVGNGSCTSEAGCAALRCNNLSINGGYTSGWFLPAGNNTGTSGQLNCLYTNRTTINSSATAAGGSGFASATYWSSTEFGANGAGGQGFGDGDQVDDDKSVELRVRCVRGFTP